VAVIGEKEVFEKRIFLKRSPVYSCKTRKATTTTLTRKIQKHVKGTIKQVHSGETDSNALKTTIAR